LTNGSGFSERLGIRSSGSNKLIRSLGNDPFLNVESSEHQLYPGDLLLLEIHRPGPNSPDPSASQKGFIPVEWWPDDFLAIQYAVAKGVVVVEAGGNGWEDLDDAVYDTPQPGFPANWANPFRAHGPDSGAIIVGAGCPPAGTHGRDQDTVGWHDLFVDRARCAFSNWGSRIDCQAWGWEVTSTGYGDLFSPGPRERLYTDTFCGTSSASPIVTGVLACLQGILKAAGKPRLKPDRARALLRATGAPQQAADGKPLTQHIGHRPDLRALVAAVLPAHGAPPH